MIRRALLVIALAAVPTMSSVAQDAAPAASGRTASWERWLGEWRAHDLTGAPGRARTIWSRGVGPHAIHVDTYLASPGKPEEKIYEGLLFWHPGRQAWVLQQFSSWGSIYDGTVTVDDRGMSYDWASFEADGTKHYRQSTTWTGADSFTWKVERETASGWVVTHEGAWRRVRVE